MPDFAQLRTTMVDTQVRPSDVTKYPIIDAMLTVPRETFVPAALRDAAYTGEHIDLGQDRVVLDPRVLAKLLDALNIQRDELVLSIGTGLGYGAAVLAHISEAVVAVEEDENLAAAATANLVEAGADNVVVSTTPLTDGAAKHGPYDAILIEGGVEDIPATILDQVKDGGRIACIFLEGALGIAKVGHKIDGDITWRMAFNATAPVLPGFKAQQTFTL